MGRIYGNPLVSRKDETPFVESVLAAAGEQMERKYVLQTAGLNLDGLAIVVAGLTGVKPHRIFIV